MKRYKLHYVMHEPYEETEDKYLVEVSALPGCKAWGDSPAEALDHVQSVAAAFIESHHELGDEFPPGVFGGVVEQMDRGLSTLTVLI